MGKTSTLSSAFNNKHSSFDIIVVGAGAAGMMAAGQAAASGAKVLLLEKMKNPGRKLGITGKGRCNLTNTATIPEIVDHFNKTGKFLRQALHQFSNTDLILFFKDQSLPLTVERGKRVFPTSGKASDVLKKLTKWLKSVEVTTLVSSRVSKIIVKNNCVHGIICNDQELKCNAIILATGGASYPSTGSTGDGFIFASDVGHSISPIRPALIPLESGLDTQQDLAGLELRNISASLFINGRKKSSLFGEMTFTKSGISGPVIITLSSAAVEALHEGNAVKLVIDLKPALDEKKLNARLIRDIENRGNESFSSLLRGLLPKELVTTCVTSTGMPANKPAYSISATERKKLCRWLKNFSLDITGHRPITEAIVTAGGISTKEINPKTMESRLIAGLYFAGEIIDVHGDTGGYNLQAAFSTGYVAGKNAALGMKIK